MYKSELAALGRKITFKLVPKPDENDDTENTEVKQWQSQQSQTEANTETNVKAVNVHASDSPQGHKPLMVAEPQFRYRAIGI